MNRPAHIPAEAIERGGAFLFKDGTAWCAMFPDFENPQESDADFGDTQDEAREQLLARYYGVYKQSLDTDAETIEGLVAAIRIRYGNRLGVEEDGNLIIVSKPGGDSLTILLHQAQLEINRERRNLDLPLYDAGDWLFEQIDALVAKQL